MTERHGERPDTPETEPAPTITSKARTATFVQGNRANATRRAADEPAPTILFGHALNDVRWGYNPRQNGSTVRDGNEPAPTILAEGLAKGVPVWDDERNPPKAGPHAVRVTLEEAAILQSFRPDYPFRGSRSKQFEQVGNSVPPLFARAVIEALLESAVEERIAA